MPRDVVDVEAFILSVEREFNERLHGRLHPSTRFRDLEDWTSLQALIVVAGFERDYGVLISAEEIGRAETLEDLHALVLERMGG